MPVDVIKLDSVGRWHARLLLSALDSLQSAKDQLRAVKDDIEHMTDGVTYTTIEAQFGAEVGLGDDIYNLVVGTVTELEADTNLVQALARIIRAT